MSSATIIDGNATAARERERIAGRVLELAETGHQPGLAAVLVGDDPASHVYVQYKERDCEAVGIASLTQRLPADTSQAQLEGMIDDLNDDPRVSGIIVQMPLPRHLDAQAALARIDPRKDADGLHPVNLGRLLRGDPHFVPATPLGCVVLLETYEIPTRGADVVIVGRSQLVGRPLAMLLGLKGTDATVTVCHSATRDLAAHTRRADILVAATGAPGLIRAEMVKPGAVVLDVGITRTDAGLVGDVDFAGAAAVAAAITPVPGGVGPMTRAMLLRNTLRAASA